VVFRSCKYPREAWEFLRYLTSASVQKKWASTLGQIPVRPDVFGEIDTQKKPALKVFFEQMLKTVARPPVPNYDKVEEIANAQMDLALQGVKSPEEALREASDLVNSQVLAPMREAN
jgi:multiple sugar transport system substrate-binding protein